ncbi:hypothetical protein Tco_0365167 [Tanacetum coccineum]
MVKEDNPVIFSNPLFNSNEDFTSSDDESLSEEDVPKETFKIYSNPLFEFDDDFTSSDVNPLFNEVLEDVESEDSFDSKLAEPTLLISPLSDTNKDECFDPGGDEIDAFLDLDISTEIENDFHDSEGDIIFLEKILINNTFPNLPSKVFLDHDPRSLKDEPNFVELVQVFDPEIHEKSFSLTFVKLTFEDRHYLPITFVIRIFLPYLTYSVDSPFLLSSGSEDTIFDPGISTFYFSSLKPVAYENPMVIFPFFCFCPKDKGIRGEIPQDHEDPCLFSILKSPGLRFSANYGILNPDHVKGLKTVQKRELSGSNWSSLIITQSQDEVAKSLRAYQWKEHGKTSPTVLSDFIGPARNPFYGPGQPKLALVHLKAQQGLL